MSNIDDFSYNTGFSDGVFYARRVTNANGPINSGDNLLRLSSDEYDTLTGVLGDILDGTGGFNGSILLTIDKIYERMTANDDVKSVAK